jgi:hypothetical protein
MNDQGARRPARRAPPYSGRQRDHGLFDHLQPRHQVGPRGGRVLRRLARRVEKSAISLRVMSGSRLTSPASAKASRRTRSSAPCPRPVPRRRPRASRRGFRQFGGGRDRIEPRDRAGREIAVDPCAQVGGAGPFPRISPATGPSSTGRPRAAAPSCRERRCRASAAPPPPPPRYRSSSSSTRHSGQRPTRRH